MGRVKSSLSCGRKFLSPLVKGRLEDICQGYFTIHHHPEHSRFYCIIWGLFEGSASGSTADEAALNALETGTPSTWDREVIGV